MYYCKKCNTIFKMDEVYKTGRSCPIHHLEDFYWFELKDKHEVLKLIEDESRSLDSLSSSELLLLNNNINNRIKIKPRGV